MKMMLVKKTILAPVVMRALQGPQQHGPVRAKHHMIHLLTKFLPSSPIWVNLFFLPTAVQCQSVRALRAFLQPWRHFISMSPLAQLLFTEKAPFSIIRSVMFIV